MKTLAVLCNVILWAFFCVVIGTDGMPQGADILLALVTFLMPIFNVVVIRILSLAGRNLRLVGFVLNICWLGVVGWLIVERYASHPAEEGLLGYVTLMALTPLVSALTLYLQIRTTGSMAVK